MSTAHLQLNGSIRVNGKLLEEYESALIGKTVSIIGRFVKPYRDWKKQFATDQDDTSTFVESVLDSREARSNKITKQETQSTTKRIKLENESPQATENAESTKTDEKHEFHGIHAEETDPDNETSSAKVETTMSDDKRWIPEPEEDNKSILQLVSHNVDDESSELSVIAKAEPSTNEIKDEAFVKRTFSGDLTDEDLNSIANVTSDPTFFCEEEKLMLSTDGVPVQMLIYCDEQCASVLGLVEMKAKVVSKKILTYLSYKLFSNQRVSNKLLNDLEKPWSQVFVK